MLLAAVKEFMGIRDIDYILAILILCLTGRVLSFTMRSHKGNGVLEMYFSGTPFLLSIRQWRLESMSLSDAISAYKAKGGQTV